MCYPQRIANKYFPNNLVQQHLTEMPATIFLPTLCHSQHPRRTQRFQHASRAQRLLRRAFPSSNHHKTHSQTAPVHLLTLTNASTTIEHSDKLQAASRATARLQCGTRTTGRCTACHLATKAAQIHIKLLDTQSDSVRPQVMRRAAHRHPAQALHGRAPV